MNTRVIDCLFSITNTKSTIAWMYIRMSFTALITAMVMCAKSQDSLMSVSVRRVHVIFSTAELKGGGKPYPKTRERPHCEEASRKPRAVS